MTAKFTKTPTSGRSQPDKPQATRAPGRAAIASPHKLATQAGLEVLEQGGNAFDAAVAITAALAVVEPSGSGLGGGGFWLLHRASDGFQTMVDGREVAPAAASQDMFLDERRVVCPSKLNHSALAAGIPGEPAALAHIAHRYGRLPLVQSLAPAIRFAREGFPVNLRLQGCIEAKHHAFNAKTAKVLLSATGAVPQIGSIIQQQDLASTLEALAARGADGFYQGPVAHRLVAGVCELEGIWTLQDLARYRVQERRPLIGRYRGATVVTAALPSSGGIGLINALNILSEFNLPSLDGGTRKHLIIEAMRRIHRDRAIHLGDPDFQRISTDTLSCPNYAAKQRATIRMDEATLSCALGDCRVHEPGQQTTHFSVIDADGNRVAGTMSLNSFFGTGLTVPGTGVLLNNEMDDFVAQLGEPNGYGLVGGEANLIQPGKRPLSSMTPTFVESNEGVLVLGTPGGSYIVGMVLLAVLDWLHGEAVEQSIAKGRFHHQFLPDRVIFEPGAFSEAEQAVLRAYGHRLVEARQPGNMQLVVHEYVTGVLKAINDPRGNGTAHSGRLLAATLE